MLLTRAKKKTKKSAHAKAKKHTTAKKHAQAKHHKKPVVKKKVVKKPVVKQPAVKQPVATKAPVTTTKPVVMAAPKPLPPPASPAPQVDPGPTTTTPIQKHTNGVFDRAAAERLLWRAGFGPGKNGADADALAAMGLEAAVKSLVSPQGSEQLIGAEPHDDDGNALAPADLWGHDHLWWLDRMVRSNQPLVERMTLVFHDWFATSNAKVDSQQQMLDQNATIRAHCLGSFTDLLTAITTDPAMLVFLDGVSNTKTAPNENYAREVMELFTLGSDRGAYTEDDVREQARAFTGWRCDWVSGEGNINFRYDVKRHDTGSKTVFGQTGNWDWQDALRLCLENQFHPSFFVTKLWSYFIPTPPDADTQAALQDLYVQGGRQIAPVVEAILMHPDLYDGPAMMKPPVVQTAGMIRMAGRTIDTTDWTWLDDMAGQQLFYPPNVSGWDDSRWLDTSTWRARWYIVVYAIKDLQVAPWDTTNPYSTTETADAAVVAALAFAGNPSITDELHQALLSFATTSITAATHTWDQGPYRGLRQNALRMLLLTSSDLLTS